MTLLLVQNAKVARNGRRPRRLALGDGLKKPVGGRITVDHVKRGALWHAALVGARTLRTFLRDVVTSSMCLDMSSESCVTTFTEKRTGARSSAMAAQAAL